METRFVAAPHVPVSWGELIDKITILEIKSERLPGEGPLANVRKELAALQKIAEPPVAQGEIEGLKAQLRQTNERLWDIENRIREKEAAGDFGAEFIALARSVYQSNDERAALKKKINLLLACELIEEKSYKSTSLG
jgi:HAMP domain-containing protein